MKQLLKDIFTQPRQTLGILSVLVPAWVYCLIALGALALVVFKIYTFGVNTEHARWVNAQNKALITAQQQAAEANKKNRDLEKTLLTQAQDFKTYYESELNNEKNHAQQLINSVRTRAQRLSIPIYSPTCTTTSGVAIVTANRPELAAETRAELSQSSSDFLVNLAAEADEVTVESNYVKELLNQCRALNQTLVAQSIITN